MKITVYHQVEFNELDPMQVVWHGNYINYFEIGRRALLEKLGYTYDQMKREGYVWPVVKLHCKYMRSAVFRQRLAIEAELVDYHNSLTVKFIIRDAETGTIITKGETTQMPVNIETGQSSIITPEHFVKQVDAIIAAEQEKEN